MEGMVLAIYVASRHFDADGRYHLNGHELTGDEMLAQIERWVRAYPLISVEDGLAEEDWPHWTQLAAALPPRVLALGDDLLCTNPARIATVIERQAATALLLKVNQIGTLTETAQAARLARSARWQIVVSARSGETEDHWLADLGGDWYGEYINVGSINQA